VGIRNAPLELGVTVVVTVLWVIVTLACGVVEPIEDPIEPRSSAQGR
jgi:hypothetical protein